MASSSLTGNLPLNTKKGGKGINGETGRIRKETVD